jgi:hypothetical protein
VQILDRGEAGDNVSFIVEVLIKNDIKEEWLLLSQVQ